MNNPNQIQVARKVAALEGMEAGLALGSGMAAIACTLLALTEAGDHIVASSLLYGGTHTLLADELPRRGVEPHRQPARRRH
jgi:O-acetylhomoserine/O-acetylserine sulfhydrylase-like pyridoxal-dependent enzyme